MNSLGKGWAVWWMVHCMPLHNPELQYKNHANKPWIRD